jgi:hypothetical protein
MRKFLIMVSVFLSLTACSLTNLDQQNGVVWEANTESPVTSGIEQWDNNLFYADSFGNIVSLWMDTGNIHWKRTLLSESILGLYTGSNDLVAVSVTPTYSAVRYYSYNEGNINFETNLNLALKDTYTVDGTKLILHTPTKLVVFNLNDGHSEIHDMVLYLNNDSIVSVVKGNGCYYLITARTRVVKVNLTFSMVNMYTDFEGTSFHGSALYLNNNLYIASEAGIKVIPSMGMPYSSPVTGKILYSPMLAVNDPFRTFLFTGVASSQRYGMGRYTQAISDLSEDWFKQTFSAVSYSPMVYSDALSVAATVDDSGLLNIYDSVTGKYVYSKYVGIVNQPNLKFQKDYFAKSAFIPVSSPSKIICYSLYFAVNKNKY